MKWTCVVLAALLAAPAPAAVKIDEATQKAIDRGLEYLAGRQNADGSWSDNKYQHNTAITSYALLAFLSQGHLPSAGKYGPEVAKGVRFLMSAQRDSDGYLIGSRGGNMYCHAMATLALAEVWGMTADEEVRKTLKRAVDLIVRCQGYEGGWRYDPHPSGADVSVTIMQVMALRAAKNGGMHVPDATMKKAIAYIERCHDPRTGGFFYQPGSRSPGFARTAAGVCSLQLAGDYDTKLLPRAVEFLKRNLESKEYFWYGHYYACHAMHTVGGKDWEDYYARMRDLLLSKQGESGEWSDRSMDRHAVGSTFQTSIAVIILSVPAHYLPIFQR